MQFSFHMQSPQCYLNEFAPFLPVFTQFKESLRAEMKVDGTVDQLRCTHLNISSDNRFQIQGEAILEGMSQPYNSHISGKLQRFYANKEGIIFLNENLLKAQGKTFDILQNLGSCLFQGEISGGYLSVCYFNVFLNVLIINRKCTPQNKKYHFSQFFLPKGVR